MNNKRPFDTIVVFKRKIWRSLIILFMPCLSIGDNVSSFTLDTTQVITDSVDNVATPLPLIKKKSGFGVVFGIRFGLGHHQNLTKDKSFTGPQLKTGDVHWTLQGEGGISFKPLIATAYLSFAIPIPRTKFVNSYNHTAEIIDNGTMLRLSLLPWESKVNFVPTIGYRWFRELARIYDPKAVNPELLNLKFKENGAIYGVEVHYSLAKKIYGDNRFVFTYLYENLNKGLHRFRIAWAEFSFSRNKRHGSDINKFNFGFLSLGIEHVRWSGGRSDWFLIANLGARLD